jgi:hypothetical protein
LLALKRARATLRARLIDRVEVSAEAVSLACSTMQVRRRLGEAGREVLDLLGHLRRVRHQAVEGDGGGQRRDEREEQVEGHRGGEDLDVVRLDLLDRALEDVLPPRCRHLCR